MNTEIIYIVCEILSVLFMAIAQNSYNKTEEIGTKKLVIRKSSIFFVLSVLPFAILFWCRGISVGADYQNYTNIYQKIANDTLIGREADWIGIGFQLICRFLSIFCGNNFYLAFAIVNTVTLVLLYKTIWQNSKNPTLALFVLLSFCLHFQIFNQFRQMLAIAITFFAVKYLKSENFIKYSICIIIAALIHNTAIVLLPCYFICHNKLNKRMIIFYVLALLVCTFGFSIIESLLSGTYYGQMYFGGKYDIQTDSSIMNLIVRIMMLIIVLLFYKKVIKHDETNVILYNMVIICTIAQIVATQSYIFARLTTYFYIYYVLLIPEVMKVAIKKGISKQIANMIIIIILIVYQFVYYNSSSGAIGGGYDEYRTIWQDKH